MVSMIDEYGKHKIMKLRQQGLSLREIGLRVGISHQTVKRVIDSENIKGRVFPWNDRNLSRQQLRRKLQSRIKKLRGCRWRRVARKYEVRWLEKFLDIAFGENGLRDDALDELGRLFQKGPTRPGRPNLQEESSRELWQNEVPISSVVLRKPDGQEYSDVEKFDYFLNRERPTRGFRSNQRFGDKEWIRCPICGRDTAFQMAPCTIFRNGQKTTRVGLGFRSSLCREKKCYSKRVDHVVTAKSQQRPIKYRFPKKIG